MNINTNSNAVEAATSMQRNQAALSQSLNRLSSGSKIVKPSDDAAGLAVSEKLSAQTSRISAARSNAQNAVSLAQTTDGFLETVASVLDRMSELATLAKDPTRNDGDIALYREEFGQLKTQLRDIVGNGANGSDDLPKWPTSSDEPAGSFNGIELFGARDPFTVSVGPESGQTLSIDQINLREVGGALSDLLWDNATDPAQPDVEADDPGALAAISAALDQVAGERAKIGSDLSRLEVVDQQLQVQAQNLEAANSRLRDVDVAQESTRLARFQLLNESSAAILQQANSLPQTVLRLLG